MKLSNHIAIALLIAAAPAIAAETVIANKDVGTAELSAADLGGMVEGKKSNWPAGAKVVLVIQPDSPAHEEFLKSCSSKSPSQFAITWKKIVFTGKGSAPISCANDAEVVAKVASTPGAIGYVADAAAAKANAGVVVIAVK
jgi:ABC-type phosphate transport system substrate-binding protein